ncbi:MAG: hypothetical protein AAGM36_11065 [Cyanobacteria bacterium J06597_1]
MGRGERTGRHSITCGLLLVAIAATVITPMAIADYPITHSTQFNLSWVFQYQAQVDGGQWYPRWLEYSNYGFGNPTFAFYPPLCMVATLPFHIMGVDIAASLVASMGLAVLVFVVGIFRYARSFFPVRIAAIAAVSAGAMPYVYVDIYQRGAIAEVWGIACIPWLLWSSHLVLCSNSITGNSVRPKDKWIRWNAIVGVAIAYGCLILSHLPTLLMVTYLWVLLPFFGPRHLGGTVRLLCGALLGGGWTAAYILPVLTDLRLVQVDVLTALEEYRPSNRLMLNGLLSLRPQLTQHWFDRSLLPLWGVAVVLVTAAALVWLGFQPQGTYRSSTSGQSITRVQSVAGYWLLVSAIALLMTTDVLGWVYPILPPLQTIQFSWRWMTLLCTTCPLLLAYLLDVARRHRHAVGRRVPVLIVTVVLAIAAANIALSVGAIRQASYDPAAISQFIQLAEAKVFPSEPIQEPQESFLYWHWRHPDGLGLVDVPEYRHRAVTLAMPPTRPYPLLEWLDREGDETEFSIGGELTLLSWEYGLRHFRATNLGEEPRVVRLRTFFYPGWVAYLGDRSIPTEPSSDGRLQLYIPAGTHDVTVRYRGTVSHRVGLWVSGVSVVVMALGWFLARSWRGRKRAAGELE